MLRHNQEMWEKEKAREMERRMKQTIGKDVTVPLNCFISRFSFNKWKKRGRRAKKLINNT